jgi:hypothetical protein
MRQKTDRAEIAEILAWLVSRPDEKLVAALNSGEIRKILAGQGIDTAFLPAGDCSLDELLGYSDELARKNLFLIESVFKVWSDDADCDPDLFNKKGFLMGDPAMHMLELYKRAGFDLPVEFIGRPDDLALELDFLAALYEDCPQHMTLQFINDHLDWVRDLLEKLIESKAPVFYIGTVRAVDSFIKNEIGRLNSMQETLA